jgi:hypothetical protein
MNGTDFEAEIDPRVEDLRLRLKKKKQWLIGVWCGVSKRVENNCRPPAVTQKTTAGRL